MKRIKASASRHHVDARCARLAVSCAALLVFMIAGAATSQQPCLEHHQPGLAGIFSRFGEVVDISGERAIVGARSPFHPAVVGRAYIFERVGHEWVLMEELAPSNGQGGDEFGRRVAIDGDFAMVASASQSDSFLGAIYVFEFNGSTWLEQQKLPPPQEAEFMGTSLALHGEVAVASASIPGEVYVFRVIDGTWEFEQTLLGSDTLPGDSFGRSVATDGQRIFIGAPGQSEACTDDNPDCLAGAIYVFEIDAQNGMWAQTHKILPPPGIKIPDVGEIVFPGWMGRHIAVHNGRLLAGSHKGHISWWNGLAGCSSSTLCGHAFIFRYEPKTDEWVVEGLLGPDHPDARSFGEAGGIDGDMVLVGARHGNIVGSSSGSAHVFRRSADGEWHEAAMLVPEQNPYSNFFGSGVALSGGLAVIGAFGENQQTGAAYFYNLEPTPGDLTCDDAANVDDLLLLLNEWGPCAVPLHCPADLNGDGVVNVDDLLILLNNWG